MAEENKGQEPEQEPVQEEEPVQESADEPQKDKPAKEKGEGLLMPILYALLAGVGAFTLALIIGIVVTFFTQPPEDPSETPSGEQSAQVTLTPAPDETETPADEEPEESGGEDADTETEEPKEPEE